MSLSIQIGNILYKKAYWIYAPLYAIFKRKQDAFEIELLNKHIRKGDQVLDIGANIGFYALILSKLVGEDGLVHCFEPDQQNFRHLQKTTLDLKNIVLNNKAVGPKTEKLLIYTSKNLNVDHRTYQPDDYDKKIEIDAVSVDDYLGYTKTNATSVKKINLIKIDIQGFEMQAIQGMQYCIKDNPNIKIISEFWPYGLRKAGSNVNAYFEFLKNNGFSVYLLHKNTLEKLNTQKVESFSALGEEKYFNILAYRENV